MSLYIFVIGAALLSVVYALVVVWKIQKSAKPTEKIAEISSAIREGAMAFLKREYRTIGLVAAVIFVLLWLVLGAKVALGFLTGAVLSALAGYIGMVVSTKTNAKVAEAVRSAGYRAAFAVDALNVTSPLFEIPRVGIYASDAPYLTLKLSGLHRRPLRAGQYPQRE